ncbi:MAG: hypothetical protein JSV27_08940 [Candidatus Bathyarchaeota archaeon]|nr:MAG: hypothetical protein JSV27_08940 [Candidatus Bathyarchaeota archaeon]
MAKKIKGKLKAVWSIIDFEDSPEAGLYQALTRIANSYQEPMFSNPIY